jgi:hypothetical protein
MASVRNVLDPKAQEEFDRRQKAQLQLMKSDLAQLMTRPEFRRFIQVILAAFPPYKGDPSFNGSENYFLDGKTAFGQWMLDQVLEACGPETFAQVLTAWRSKPKEEEENA